MTLQRRRVHIVALLSTLALWATSGCDSDSGPSAALATSAPEATSASASMSWRSDAPVVVVLTDEQVAEALDSAPSIMDIESLELVGGGDLPTRFSARVELVASSRGAYEFELRDSAGDQLLAAGTLDVDLNGIDIAQQQAPGRIRIAATEASATYPAASVEVDGLDVGFARHIFARVRRVPSPAAERPWEQVLGCSEGDATFQWRNPDDDVVKVGACPKPFEWISIKPKVPSLAPTPEQVASAAGFTGTASLEQHFARLFAAVGGDDGPYDPLHLKFEINMLIEMAPGLNRSVPLELLGPMAAPDWDPAVVAASVEQAIEYTAQNPTALEFNIQVISTDPKATVLVVNGVQLPLTAARAD